MIDPEESKPEMQEREALRRILTLTYRGDVESAVAMVRGIAPQSNRIRCGLLEIAEVMLLLRKEYEAALTVYVAVEESVPEQFPLPWGQICALLCLCRVSDALAVFQRHAAYWHGGVIRDGIALMQSRQSTGLKYRHNIYVGETAKLARKYLRSGSVHRAFFVVTEILPRRTANAFRNLLSHTGLSKKRVSLSVHNTGALGNERSVPRSTFSVPKGGRDIATVVTPGGIWRAVDGKIFELRDGDTWWPEQVEAGKD
jgi:hypothetical protein